MGAEQRSQTSNKNSLWIQQHIVLDIIFLGYLYDNIKMWFKICISVGEIVTCLKTATHNLPHNLVVIIENLYNKIKGQIRQMEKFNG
jgi:hypothetical protein